MTKSVYWGTNPVENSGIILSINPYDPGGSSPIGVVDMTIQFNKFLRASLSKIALVHADRVLVREVELAREKAWHDAYLDGGIIG